MPRGFLVKRQGRLNKLSYHDHVIVSTGKDIELKYNGHLAAKKICFKSSTCNSSMNDSISSPSLDKFCGEHERCSKQKMFRNANHTNFVNGFVDNLEEMISGYLSTKAAKCQTDFRNDTSFPVKSFVECASTTSIVFITSSQGKNNCILDSKLFSTVSKCSATSFSNGPTTLRSSKCTSSSTKNDVRVVISTPGFTSFKSTTCINNNDSVTSNCLKDLKLSTAHSTHSTSASPTEQQSSSAGKRLQTAFPTFIGTHFIDNVKPYGRTHFHATKKVETSPKLPGAIRKINFDAEFSVPVSTAIMNHQLLGEDSSEDDGVAVSGDIDRKFNVVVATTEAREQLAKVENKIGDYVCQLCKELHEDAFQLAQHHCSKIVHIEYR